MSQNSKSSGRDYSNVSSSRAGTNRPGIKRDKTVKISNDIVIPLNKAKPGSKARKFSKNSEKKKSKFFTIFQFQELEFEDKHLK